MRVRRVELEGFRSYRRAALDLGPGVTVLVGPNGQGKTNVVEALHRVAAGASHRVAGDGPLVRDGADEALVHVDLTTDEGRERRVDLRLGPGGTRAKVDGNPARRAGDAVGVLRAVMFAPEDLGLVRGDPGERRRWLDAVLGQRRAVYAATLAEYERTLRQRNALLRDLRGRGASPGSAAAESLAAWTQQLVAQGAPLVAARLAAIAALRAPVSAAHRALTGTDTPVDLAHRSEVDLPDADPEPDVADVAARLTASLADVADEELRRGQTLVGPHRDDVLIELDGRPARTTASQGEAWSVALALRVGSAELLSQAGDRPVLLLDDVFSELDDARRARVAALCAGFDQVVVTAAVDADVPLDGPRVDVRRDTDGSHLTPRGPSDDGHGHATAVPA
ncbi:MAG: DNA replication/repair protein RecF [Nitriliruptoraceae bacterium]